MTDDHPVDLDTSRGMAAVKASDRMDSVDPAEPKRNPSCTLRGAFAGLMLSVVRVFGSDSSLN